MEIAGTPDRYIARGSPWPKLTPVQTLCLPGSSSRMTRPSQPSGIGAVGSAVCQMSIDRKCDLSGFGYPTPAMIAKLPWSYISLNVVRAGWNPYWSSTCSRSSSGMPTVFRKS